VSTSIHIAGCGGSGTESADTVFRNGKVVTVDGSSSVVQAFAVRSGRFVALGSNDDVDGFVGSSTKVVDLGGRTVIPGLADAHMHNEGGGPGMDLSLARTIVELLARVSAAATAAKAGDVLVSNNDWHEAQLTEQRLPLATELEAAAPGIPVLLVRGGLTTFSTSPSTSGTSTRARRCHRAEPSQRMRTANSPVNWSMPPKFVTLAGASGNGRRSLADPAETEHLRHR
jgi:hypothetical protein